MSRNVCLIGMMGVGKTTIARQLAETLGRTAVDTDDEIVRFVGRSIPEIFAEAGEEYFRAVERQVVREVARADDLVIALGGGAVLSDANVAELLLTGLIVELRAPADVLAARLRDQADGRPLLLGGDLDGRIDALLDARADRYAEVADVTVDAAGSIDEVVGAILAVALERGDVLTPSEHERLLP